MSYVEHKAKDGATYWPAPELVKASCTGCAVRNIENLCSELHSVKGGCKSTKSIWVQAPKAEDRIHTASDGRTFVAEAEEKHGRCTGCAARIGSQTDTLGKFLSQDKLCGELRHVFGGCARCGFIWREKPPAAALRAQPCAAAQDSFAAACVDKGYHWAPIDARTPRGVKLQLINERAGVAVYAILGAEERHWTHWAALPTFKREQQQ